MVVRSLVAVTVAAAVIVGLARSAVAAPASARLSYTREQGAETCPDESVLRRAVSDRLGYDPFAGEGRRAVVTRVGATGAAFWGVVAIRDPDAPEEAAPPDARSLRTEAGCAELVLALALSISVALDPAGALGPSPDTTPAPIPAPLPPRLVLAAGIGASAAFGVAPSPVAAGVLYVAARRGVVGASLEGSMSASGSIERSLGRVRSRTTSGALGLCVHPGSLARPLGPVLACALGWVGRIEAEGEAVPVPRQEGAWTFGAGGRLGLAVPLLTHLEGRLEADLLANLTRHTLRLRQQDVHEFPVLFGAVTAAIGAVF